VTISALGWDVSITPVGFSWYSEAAVSYSGQIVLTPGAGDNFGGDGIPQSYSSDGLLVLADEGLPDIVLPTGILVLEFFETFDDVPDAIDATWNGTLTIDATVVPLAPAFALLLGGLLPLGALGRRKR
jgi:hypothetical protein